MTLASTSAASTSSKMTKGMVLTRIIEKSKAKADKNFFFIDEGFGTQDSEAINIVFETITGLLKDNRIVGIISHVEELKERIPLSLTITKDNERGSIIKGCEG